MIFIDRQIELASVQGDIAQLDVPEAGPRIASTRSSSTPNSGSHLRAERFEEDVADLFKLQDQVARLANTLGLQLVKAEAERGTRSKNPDVLDLTMRGNALFQLQPLTKDNNDAARTAFEQALKIDPNDVAALTGDAVAHLHEKQLGWARPEIDYDAKILGQAQRAIPLAPQATLAGARAVTARRVEFDERSIPKRLRDK